MKRLTSGFFDQLNPRQIQFLENVAQHGELHVGIGSDENYFKLRNSSPLYRQQDRAAMVSSLRCVASVVLLDGRGEADFGSALAEITPQQYIASRFNDTADKRELCAQHGVEYVIWEENPNGDPVQSRQNFYFPYRICMTGGWLDQPWVSQVFPGAVTVLGIEPDREFMFRAGMATSSRETAKRIWSTFPSGDPLHLAEILFGAENPPGKQYVSGSQDALGLCLPGFSKLHYQGGYWPTQVDSVLDQESLDWLESVVWMVPLRERHEGYNPLLEKNVTPATVSELARSSELAVAGVQQKSVPQLGEGLRLTLDSWRKMLPLTVPEEFQPTFDQYDKFAGYNLSGCGGGYLIVISDQPVPNGFQIQVRR